MNEHVSPPREGFSVHIIRSEEEWEPWRRAKAAERMALLKLPPEEAQAQADLFDGGASFWRVDWDHEALYNRLPDLPPRRQESSPRPDA